MAVRSKFKDLAKRSLAGLAYGARKLPGLDLRGRSGQAIVTFCLHRVLAEDEMRETCSLPGMTMSLDLFRQFCEFIHSEFIPVTLEQALSPNRTRSPKPVCLLTFDDGWLDNYSNAFPVLQEFRIPAVIFLTTGVVGKQQPFWVEKLICAFRQNRVPRDRCLPPCTTVDELYSAIGRLKQYSANERDSILNFLFTVPEDSSHPIDRMMSWNEIIEMRDLVHFGAHTTSHPLLPYEEKERIRTELLEPRLAIEEALGSSCRVFAYPNGAYDERVRELVSECGYEAAFTTRPGLQHPGDDPFLLNRVVLHGGNISWNGRFSASALHLAIARGWLQ